MEQKQKPHYAGLNAQEVADSRTANGSNVLTPPQKTPLWKEFLGKFADPIIIILLVALALSFGVSCYEYYSIGDVDVFFDPVGILLAILLATCVGFAFEWSAKKKFEVLNQVNDDTLVKAVRTAMICQIPRKEVVVGDIIIIETGDEIPADGELLEAVSLQVNEATLTGEPMMPKTIDEAEFHADSTYPSNAVMKGTTVIEGHGIFKVTCVGDYTEYGKVYKGSQIDNGVKTPLNIQLDRLSRFITWGSYCIAALILVGRVGLYFYNTPNVDWLFFLQYVLHTAMIAVTVIVVAVPEGLPMSVALSLALSMKRMLTANNLVRKMHACETMGACTVICTDKTGTLTQNQMRVFETRFPISSLGEDTESNLIKEGIAVNSTAYLDYTTPERISALGNPTEGAMLLWLHGQGLDYMSLRHAAEVKDQLPFSTERKYMATVVSSPLLGKTVLYVKGAPEVILSLCEGVADRADIEGRLLAYQQQAMRTLGFAYKIIETSEGEIANYFVDGRLAVKGLSFLGIVAISDPVREEVPAAIRTCLNAGISVKIVTGDTPGTAKEIGRQIGLWLPTDGDAQHITGPDFAALSDEELLQRVGDFKVISRARPLDKQRLVKALQDLGEVVAVTGDGTNDAPALKAAQVGLSMGDGTSVAKEASAITILDNSFRSIGSAVMWGRSLYQNIQRFILFQMTINVAACLIVLVGAFFSTESPLTVTQMLWVNLIMDTFAAMALASLPPNEKVMEDKPRRTTDFIITRPMAVRILSIGITFVILLFGLLQYFKYVDVVPFSASGEAAGLAAFSISAFAKDLFNVAPVANGLTEYELSLFFTIFVMLQFWNMFNARTLFTKRSAFSDLAKCRSFLVIALVIFIGQILIVTFGGKMFTVVPISVTDWIIITIATSFVLWVGEALRLLAKWRS